MMPAVRAGQRCLNETWLAHWSSVCVLGARVHLRVGIVLMLGYILEKKKSNYLYRVPHIKGTIFHLKKKKMPPKLCA